jgi:hypothetical protein
MICGKKEIVTQTTSHVALRATSHTSPKSRDHEIARAQKKVCKGRPNIPPKSYCSVVTDPQCSVKPYVTGSSTKCYFNDFFIHARSHA